MDTTTEMVTTEVEYMQDVDVQWISLVDRGANRTPFKIVKNLDAKEDSMDDVIQSVITPISKNFDEYKESNEWSRDFKVLRSESHGDYNKYVGFPLEELEASSVKIIKLSETDDVFAIVGTPKEIKESYIVYKSTVMDTPVGFDEYGLITFGDTFYKQLNDTISAIAGTMNIEGMDNKKKKTAIANALDALKAFISAGLDLSSTPVAVAMRELSTFVEKSNDTESEANMSEVNVEKTEAKVETPQVEVVSKSEEKILEMIATLTQKIEELSAKADAVQKKEEVSVEKVEEPVKEEFPFQKFEDLINEVKSKVEKLEATVEKIDADVPEPSVVQEVAKEEASVAKNDSPFVGIFDHINKRR